ncbi:hypothetical protein HPB47_014851 [Ixodes persulcatus]|uniref:Uncharacterized protein n=1 Tax=Ixodes persulcatus TaxID=34615 RepID=A0AC60QXI5_IXOPE|nr:hypothetical protein HPB47_014851 [Ixodes persulcatus]
MNNEIDMENSASTRTSGTHMEFDENSGRTLSQPGPWYEVLKERKSQKTADENRIKGDSKANSAQNLNGETSGLTNPKMQPTNNQLQQQRRGDGRTRGGNNTPPRKRMLPPLPEDEYKVVYRPRTGLNLSTWHRHSRRFSIQFYSNVTIQTQWAQNLIIASTADEDYAMKLSMITQKQLGAALYELMPFLKPLPGTVRGIRAVLQGLRECRPQTGRLPQPGHKQVSTDAERKILKTITNASLSASCATNPTKRQARNARNDSNQQHERSPLPQYRVMSWPQLGSHSPHAADPFPPLPVKQQDSKHSLRATSPSDRAPADTDEGQWEDQLTSSKPEEQSQLVNRARLAARDYGILD